jgi:hypothetical protein
MRVGAASPPTLHRRRIEGSGLDAQYLVACRWGERLGSPNVHAVKGAKEMFKSRMRILVPRSLVLCAVAAFGLSPVLERSEVAGQDLTYTSVTRGEFAGALGTFMNLVPGAQDPTRETTYMKGSLMRTDEGNTSTIMDLAEGRFTHVDHGGKTFYTLTFEELQAEMAAALEGMQTEQPQDAPHGEEPEVTFDVRLSTERTGRRMSFDGYSAEQVLMIVEVVPRSTDPAAAQEDAGSMVLFNEVWLSNDFPGLAAIRDAQAKAAGEMLESMQAGLASALQQAFAQDPRMQEAFERSAQEMEDLDGLAVKTISSFVLLTPGMELDREAILAAADQPLASGAGDVLAGAATAGAQEAARSAVRGLTRGILGRRQEEPAAAEPEARPSQSIVMRTTSVVEDVGTSPLSADLFLPPPDYVERKPEWAGDPGSM